MVRYIKERDGKLAGSIGNGKTKFPTVGFSKPQTEAMVSSKTILTNVYRNSVEPETDDTLFTEHNKTLYKYGTCYKLAHELHKIAKEKGLNWRLVAVTPNHWDLQNHWVHFGVITEDGAFLDIDGASRRRQNLEDRWGKQVRLTSRRQGYGDQIGAAIRTVMGEEDYRMLTKDQDKNRVSDEHAKATAHTLFNWYFGID